MKHPRAVAEPPHTTAISLKITIETVCKFISGMDLVKLAQKMRCSSFSDRPNAPITRSGLRGLIFVSTVCRTGCAPLCLLSPHCHMLVLLLHSCALLRSMDRPYLTSCLSFFSKQCAQSISSTWLLDI